jgi:hypothetical protein
MVAQRTHPPKRPIVLDTHPGAPVSSPLRVVLTVRDGSERPKVISMPLREQLVLGRVDASSDSHPDIDLSAFSASENGVSRHHARLIHDDSSLQLEDLRSTNGTRINGFQITPQRLYRLRNGDELELGHLRMTIQLVRAPI